MAEWVVLHGLDADRVRWDGFGFAGGEGGVGVVFAGAHVLFQRLREAATEHGQRFGDLNGRGVLDGIELPLNLLQPFDQMADAGDPAPGPT